jgi:predicted membrane protein
VSDRLDAPVPVLSLLKHVSVFEYLLLAYVIGFVGACYVLASIWGHADRFEVFLYSQPFVAASVIVPGLLLYGRVMYVMIAVRPRYLTRYLLADLKQTVLAPTRIRHAIVPLFTLLIFFGSFTSMKALIPAFNPYSWDSFFFEMDRVLHLGVDPWRISHRVFGHPFATFAINVVYNCWIPIMLGVVCWQVFSWRSPRLRMQFLCAFFLSWTIVGVLMATIFSSAGPCFYSEVVSSADPYEPLMTRLSVIDQRFPIWALDVQRLLWEQYRRSDTGLGSGISAMPSVHVSIAFLMFLLGARTSRWAAAGFGVYALAIQIGSVHLAWHYAVDGYLAILLTWLIWYISGRICDRIASDAPPGLTPEGVTAHAGRGRPFAPR